jgi:hypothetical protein
MKPGIVILLAGVLASAVPANATIINVPDDQPIIQAGIEASIDGDTVLVQPNTYYENINFNGHNIMVGSPFVTTDDPSYISLTIIDGNQSGSVVSFANGENESAIITGFTIQNGLAPEGGGIYCSPSNPRIYYNIVSGNAGTWGGGVYCHSSNLIVNCNEISGNSSDWNGGGIYCLNSSAYITHNTISGNSSDRNAGGISCALSDATITNNTISGNSAALYGGGTYCYDCSPLITNTILWGNIAPFGPEIYIAGSPSPVFSYCDVEGGWGGEGNISLDPLFRNPGNGDFHLMSSICGDPTDSPCTDAGNPSICDSISDCNWGLGEIRSDIGAYGGCAQCSEIPTLSQWGKIILGLFLLAEGTVAFILGRKKAFVNEHYRRVAPCIHPLAEQAGGED